MRFRKNNTGQESREIISIGYRDCIAKTDENNNTGISVSERAFHARIRKFRKFTRTCQYSMWNV